MIDMDDFQVLGSGKSSSRLVANSVGFSVYKSKSHSNVFQLNIKFGTDALEALKVSTGDKVQMRYSAGKRQILFIKSDNGYTLRPDGSMRRNINQGWHHEPFPEKEIKLTPFIMEPVQHEGVIYVLVQLPKENNHD